jgi:hypothetical protein
MTIFKKIIRALVGPVSLLLAALVLMSDFAGTSTGGVARFFIAGIIVFAGCLFSSHDFSSLVNVFRHPLKEIASLLRKFER